MSDITKEDVMEYCYSRNLMLVTKESLEYMHRPIVIETMNKNAIPIEWINNWLNTGRNAKYFIPMMEMIKEWEKENEKQIS